MHTERVRDREREREEVGWETHLTSLLGHRGNLFGIFWSQQCREDYGQDTLSMCMGKERERTRPQWRALYLTTLA